MSMDPHETDLDRSLDAMAGIVEEHDAMIRRLTAYYSHLQQLEVNVVVTLDRLQKRTVAALEQLHAARAEYSKNLRAGIATREACDRD